MVTRIRVSTIYLSIKACNSWALQHQPRPPQREVLLLRRHQCNQSSKLSASSANPVHVDHKTNSLGSSSAPSRRRRGQGRSKRLDEENIPSYKEFVHRFTVLSLYRGYLKSIRKSLRHNQEELHEQVRREFRANKAESDPFNIQRALTEGKRRFAELQEFTGGNNKYEHDSWMNTQDEEDPRGRVGQGWPWQK
jgi:Complex 1 protein (LYR family)